MQIDTRTVPVLGKAVPTGHNAMGASTATHQLVKFEYSAQQGAAWKTGPLWKRVPHQAQRSVTFDVPQFTMPHMTPALVREINATDDPSALVALLRSSTNGPVAVGTTLEQALQAAKALALMSHDSKQMFAVTQAKNGVFSLVPQGMSALWGNDLYMSWGDFGVDRARDMYRTNTVGTSPWSMKDASVQVPKRFRSTISDVKFEGVRAANDGIKALAGAKGYYDLGTGFATKLTAYS